MSYKLSLLAEEDFISIARHSVNHWGKTRAKQYMTALNNCFERLNDTPQLGKSREGVKSNYLSINEGSHVVFYKLDDNNHVIIIRILHQRMDFTRYL